MKYMFSDNWGEVDPFASMKPKAKEYSPSEAEYRRLTRFATTGTESGVLRSPIDVRLELLPTVAKVAKQNMDWLWRNLMGRCSNWKAKSLLLALKLSQKESRSERTKSARQVADQVRNTSQMEQLIAQTQELGGSLGNVRGMLQEWLNRAKVWELLRSKERVAEWIALAHPKPRDKEREEVFGFILGREGAQVTTPVLVVYQKVESPDTPFRLRISLAKQYGVPLGLLGDGLAKSPKLWAPAEELGRRHYSVLSIADARRLESLGVDVAPLVSGFIHQVAGWDKLQVGWGLIRYTFSRLLLMGNKEHPLWETLAKWVDLVASERKGKLGASSLGIELGGASKFPSTMPWVRYEPTAEMPEQQNVLVVEGEFTEEICKAIFAWLGGNG